MSQLYTKFLKKLIEFDVDLKTASAQLNYFGVDCEIDLVLLGRNHLINALEFYIEDKLSNEDIEHWADMIETNESIKVNDETVSHIVYELANPYLTHPLSKERAKDLLLLAKSRTNGD